MKIKRSDIYRELNKLIYKSREVEMKDEDFDRLIEWLENEKQSRKYGREMEGE